MRRPGRVVGDVDRDVHRAEALLDDARDVPLAQVRHRDVVAVEERHPEVAVAEVERVAQARRVLVHEAEHAVVAAGLDAELVEVGAEGLVGLLADGLLLHAAAAAHAQRQPLLGRLEAEVQLVLDGLAVDGEHLVAGRPAEAGGDGAGVDGGDADGHGAAGVDRRSKNGHGARGLSAPCEHCGRSAWSGPGRYVTTSSARSSVRRWSATAVGTSRTRIPTASMNGASVFPAARAPRRRARRRSSGSAARARRPALRSGRRARTGAVRSRWRAADRPRRRAAVSMDDRPKRGGRLGVARAPRSGRAWPRRAAST